MAKLLFLNSDFYKGDAGQEALKWPVESLRAFWPLKDAQPETRQWLSIDFVQHSKVPLEVLKKLQQITFQKIYVHVLYLAHVYYKSDPEHVEILK